MRRKLSLNSLMLFLMSFLFIVSGNFSNIKAGSNKPDRTILIQLKINEKEFETLKEMKIEFASKFIEDGSFAIVSQAELSFLNERNFKFKKIKQSENKLDLYKRALYGKTLKLDPIYHTNSEIIQELKQHTKKYPHIIMMKKIGNTSEKKEDIWAVKISGNVQDEEDEPAILFSGGIHSCELGGVEICMKLIDYLLSNYKKNSKVTDCVNTNEIWIIPVINVDGHDVVTENIDPRWRKNVRDNNGNGILYEYDEDGVDLNRNFDFNWAFGGSGESTNERYRGELPFSENESIAVRDLALEQKFLLSVTYHSQGEVIFYPWIWRGRKAPDDKLLTKLANGLAGSIKTMKGDTTYKALYGAGTVGQTYPWFYGVLGTFDFIVETGLSRHIFPLHELKNIVESNLEGTFYMLDQMKGPGLTGKITDAENGEALVAEVWFPDIETEDVEPRTSNLEYGRFFRLLEPGSYRVIFRKNNYQPQVFKNVEISDHGWKNLDIQLRTK